MPLPLLSTRDAVKLLSNNFGFEERALNKGSNSHLILVRKLGCGRTVEVSLPYAREIPRGTLRNILRTGEVDRKAFEKIARG